MAAPEAGGGATLVLTQSEVRSVLSMDDVVGAVEEAFAAHGRGETMMPVKVYLELERYAGDFRAMPAYMDGIAGVKWVNSHPENPRRHSLPAVRGLYVLSDAETAVPLAIMDATWLTAMRTGAAAAVASKHLARAPVRTLGLVGCGVQARTLVAAHRVVFREFEILAADVRAEAAAELVDSVGGRVATIAEAAACDVVCTATPARAPVVERAWVRPGAHVNAMGADAHGKQELDAGLLTAAAVIVDDLAQAREGGEVNVPIARGELDPRAIRAALGEVICGARPGRQSDEEITIFDSTGLAVQDLVVARLAWETARSRGVGLALDLSA